ncbi:transposase family protein [Rhizobium sp. LCM 4573]|uniref:transposase family protein n=1 Tax=Rhizobium sp. LCM 4573 TaxID=1848291 RepID=UPI001FCD1D42|nr:transposase family protein [Rhizobium sp. LCM 4573]
MSRTVRSRYCRQVADLPLSGRRVRLLVRTRRFICDAVLCGRQTFSERSAMCCHPTPGEPGVWSISSTSWRLRLEDARRPVLPNS